MFIFWNHRFDYNNYNLKEETDYEYCRIGTKQYRFGY